jgi:hypothetical protein
MGVLIMVGIYNQSINNNMFINQNYGYGNQGYGYGASAMNAYQQPASIFGGFGYPQQQPQFDSSSIFSMLFSSILGQGFNQQPAINSVFPGVNINNAGQIGNVNTFAQNPWTNLLKNLFESLLAPKASTSCKKPATVEEETVEVTPGESQPAENSKNSMDTPLYGFVNRNATDHFYTTNADAAASNPGYEKQALIGNISSTQKSGTVPLYGFVNRDTADHIYTTNADASNSNKGYEKQALIGYISPTQTPGTVPLYEFSNPVATDHFYTTNADAANSNPGYKMQNLIGYVKPD